MTFAPSQKTAHCGRYLKQGKYKRVVCFSGSITVLINQSLADKLGLALGDELHLEKKPTVVGIVRACL